MIRQFFVSGMSRTALEQDVKVTEVREKNVPIVEGDMVELLVRAPVERVTGEQGVEVQLGEARLVKVVQVLRRKR